MSVGPSGWILERMLLRLWVMLSEADPAFPSTERQSRILVLQLEEFDVALQALVLQILILQAFQQDSHSLTPEYLVLL